jgi:hypothetical protein
MRTAYISLTGERGTSFAQVEGLVAEQQRLLRQDRERVESAEALLVQVPPPVTLHPTLRTSHSTL